MSGHSGCSLPPRKAARVTPQNNNTDKRLEKIVFSSASLSINMFETYRAAHLHLWKREVYTVGLYKLDVMAVEELQQNKNKNRNMSTTRYTLVGFTAAPTGDTLYNYY